MPDAKKEVVDARKLHSSSTSEDESHVKHEGLGSVVTRLRMQNTMHFVKQVETWWPGSQAPETFYKRFRNVSGSQPSIAVVRREGC